jgi:hypothetical protein
MALSYSFSPYKNIAWGDGVQFNNLLERFDDKK